ncbi:hypothetical protein BKA64DRAFT_182061 [Cadophora sp. MPI-SDFR-AT-0126]|nr:hypothetical protein BKA64DRAFT_182061 [Leotiomycetes sp. MPI-SDFR-AT-0126]
MSILSSDLSEAEGSSCWSDIFSSAFLLLTLNWTSNACGCWFVYQHSFDLPLYLLTITPSCLLYDTVNALFISSLVEDFF